MTAWFMNALSVSDWPTHDKRDKHFSQIIFLQKHPYHEDFPYNMILSNVHFL